MVATNRAANLLKTSLSIAAVAGLLAVLYAPVTAAGPHYCGDSLGPRTGNPDYGCVGERNNCFRHWYDDDTDNDSQDENATEHRRFCTDSGQELDPPESGRGLEHEPQ